MSYKIIQDKDGKRIVGVCAHCGNSTPQKVLFEHIGTEIFHAIDGDDEISVQIYYSVTECGTCEELLFYRRPDYEDETSMGKLLYPSRKTFSNKVPEKIRKAYMDATAIAKVGSPSAYAVLIRRALEFILQDKHVKGKSLAQQIKKMAIQDKIPPIFLEMTDSIRILGNYGAHANNVELTHEDVKVMDDFFVALLEYIYIAPQKIEVLRKRLKNLKK